MKIINNKGLCSGVIIVRQLCGRFTDIYKGMRKTISEDAESK